MWNWSLVADESFDILTSNLELWKPRKILEIGTFQGVSAAYLSHLCEHVLTVDIWQHPLRDMVFERGRGKGAISAILTNNQHDRDEYIIYMSGQVDLVILDGSHLYRDVEHDYALTCACKNLLFHDYGWESIGRKYEESWPDVTQFVNQLHDDCEFSSRYSIQSTDVFVAAPFAWVSR